MSKHPKSDLSLFDPVLVGPAVKASFVKMKPSILAKNPVMFVTGVVALMATFYVPFSQAEISVMAQIAAWLWFTVLFANFAEAMAEGRGKAQAETLRKSRQDIQAKKLAEASRDAKQTSVKASELRKGDVVLVEAGKPAPVLMLPPGEFRYVYEE